MFAIQRTNIDHISFRSYLVSKSNVKKCNFHNELMSVTKTQKSNYGFYTSRATLLQKIVLWRRYLPLTSEIES